MAEYSRIPVGELVASGEAELKTGPFGTQLKASDYTENGTPVINVRNIGFGGIKVDKLEFISPATRDRLSSHVLKNEDIVFGRKGAVERHVFIRQEQNGWFQGSDCLRLRFASKRVEPLFASYYFLTADHQRWMMNTRATRSGMRECMRDMRRRLASADFCEVGSNVVRESSIADSVKPAKSPSASRVYAQILGGVRFSSRATASGGARRLRRSRWRAWRRGDSGV